MALFFTHVIYVNYVGMVAQTPHRTRFSRDSLAAGLIEAGGSNQGERNLAIEIYVAREINSLAAAFAERTEDLVAAVDE